MSLPFGLLGLLEYSSYTGYDLAKVFEESINLFWHAQSSQIYRELHRMEEKGWITAESIIQEGKPNKRLYTITDKGRSVFVEWLNTPGPLFENAHVPLLMYTMFGASAPEATLERMKMVRDGITANLEGRAKQVEKTIEKFKAIAPNSEERSVYWQMTHEYGLAQAKAALQWAHECIEKLEAKINV